MRQQVEQGIARQRADRQPDQQLQDVAVVMRSDFGDGGDCQQTTDTDEDDGSCSIKPQRERGNRLFLILMRCFSYFRVNVMLMLVTVRVIRGVSSDVDSDEAKDCQKDGWSPHADGDDGGSGCESTAARKVGVSRCRRRRLGIT